MNPFTLTLIKLAFLAMLWLFVIAAVGVIRADLFGSKAAVRAAKEVGAKDVPQAQLHTQLAEEQVQQAQKLIEDGENERAEMLLRRAQADAELAVALAREQESEKQAQAAEAALGPQPGAQRTNMQATNQ